MKKIICLFICVLFVLCGCKANENKEEVIPEDSIDYMVLVNKLNPLPEDYEAKLNTVHMTNSIGDDVEVESKAYEAYLKLKETMEAEGIYIDLDSARRSVAQQQEIMDEFTEKYGKDYALKTVATPGYSEHHTGLALDLYLRINNEDIIYNEDLVQYPDIWAKIHEHLAENGFILRYLEGKEHITGYGYEPWHIRYIDNAEVAKEIMDKGITFEGYLGAVNETDPEIDLGDSKLFSVEELKEAVIQIKCQFATFKDCELHKIAYDSDENNNQDNIKWLSEVGNNEYTDSIKFTSEFHSPLKEVEGSVFDIDKEYTDYGWWLARTTDGNFELVSYGY